MKIHPDLIAKLKEQELNYVKVSEFAETIPLFSKQIIQDELTSERFCKIGDRYKNIYFSWGINWQVTPPTNFPADMVMPKGLIGVYVNCMSLFDNALYSYAHKTLYSAMKDVPAYFVDNYNSTWYFLPEEVEVGLDALCEWYAFTQKSSNDILKQMKKEKLEAQIRALEEQP